MSSADPDSSQVRSPAASRRGSWAGEVPRWFLLALLIWAPWAYGSTRPWTVEVLRCLLLGLSGLFVMALITERRMPRLPMWPGIFVVGLLAIGWWMTFNARAVFDPVGPAFHMISAWMPWLPGTMDQSRSVASMLLVTGMLGAFCVTAEMAGEPRWRDRLWLVVALVGISLIAFGIFQRLSGARTIFWAVGEKTGSTFFATFRYHANAGAFINLVMPFVLARTLLIFRRESPQWQKAFWTIASSIVVAAAFINVSRAAMTIALILLLVLGGWWLFFERRTRITRPAVWGGAIVIILVAGLLAYAFGADRSITRWLEPKGGNELSNNLRYQVYDIIWKKTLPSVGWGGSGPGTFEMVFPLSIKEAGNDAVGRWYWVNAHQDYLQALTEWGVIGGILWAGLLLGGFGVGIWRLTKRSDQWRSETRYFLLAGCSALLGISLHALVDFPLQIGSLQLFTAISCAVVWTVGSGEGNMPVRRRRRRSMPRETEEPA